MDEKESQDFGSERRIMGKQQYQDMDMIERMIYGPKQWATLSMAAVNMIVFAVTSFFGLDAEHMVKYGAAVTPYILQGEYYRLFTSMFLHFDLQHLIGNMVMLILLGAYLERFVGKARYLAIYLLGGIAGNLLSMALEIRTGEYAISAGASGAVFATVGGLLALLIVHRGRLADLTLRRVSLMAILSAAYGFSSYGVNNAAHIGGLAAGFLAALLLYRRGSRRYRENCISEQEAGW